jgi:hypothetical protein
VRVSKALIDAADAGDFVLEVPPVILAETVYTLESFYEMDRFSDARRFQIGAKT